MSFGLAGTLRVSGTDLLKTCREFDNTLIVLTRDNDPVARPKDVCSEAQDTENDDRCKGPQDEGGQPDNRLNEEANQTQLERMPTTDDPLMAASQAYISPQ